MSRTFLQRLRSSEWWLEQAAHFFAGDVLGQIVGWAVYGFTGSNLWSGVAAVVSAAIGAAIREMIQNIGDKDNNIPDSIADTFFVTLGGARAAYPFWVLS